MKTDKHGFPLNCAGCNQPVRRSEPADYGWFETDVDTNEKKSWHISCAITTRRPRRTA